MKLKLPGLLWALLFVACTSSPKRDIYTPEWESLKKHQVPEWLQDAKFGIYAHWGVYSVPAFGTEWYGRRMYDMDRPEYAHHLATYGDPSSFGYKDFIPLFKAEHYDPRKWAELIAASGAKYAGLATVHHDGFCLWDSEFTQWDAAEKGPMRDLYGELVTELRKLEDMKILATFHHIRTFDWYLPYKKDFYLPIDQEDRKRYLNKDWDLFDEKYADLYCHEDVGRNINEFIDEWRNKVKEVMDKYQPDVVWFDGGLFQEEASEKKVLDILSYYYNKENQWEKPLEALNKLPANMKFNFGPDMGIAHI